MPIAMEKALRRAAAKLAKSRKLKERKGETTREATDRFVYGAMRRKGWRPGKGR
jgi:hypothetical protein